MWKAKIAAIAVVVNTAAIADPVERIDNLDTFDAVEYALPYKVEFVQTSSPFVELEGNDDAIERIDVEVRRGNLYLTRQRSPWWKSFRGDVSVVIGYDNLEAITMAGSGDGKAESIQADAFRVKIAGSAGLEINGIQADELNIAVSGSGRAELDGVIAMSVATTIAGSGNVKLVGTTTNQSVSISGSGDHNARNLQSSIADAKVRGSGDIVLWANEELDATVMGSGDIDYYGNASVSRRVQGSGDLRHRGQEP